MPNLSSDSLSSDVSVCAVSPLPSSPADLANDVIFDPVNTSMKHITNASARDSFSLMWNCMNMWKNTLYTNIKTTVSTNTGYFITGCFFPNTASVWIVCVLAFLRKSKLSLLRRSSFMYCLSPYLSNQKLL